MYPKIDDLLKKVDSKYTLVVLAAKRARQINDYLNAVNRPDQLPPTVKGPQVKTVSSKPLTIAMEEIVDDKVTYERLVDGIK